MKKKRKYNKPIALKVTIDRDISLVMASTPPGDPLFPVKRGDNHRDGDPPPRDPFESPFR